MRVIWSPNAVHDLIALQDYIAEDSPAAARRVARLLLTTVTTTLPENPAIGRPGRVPGTRELVIPRTPYIVPYRIQADTIEILRVYHAARRWPDRF